MKSIEQELEELQTSLAKIEEHQARENAFAELANVRFERNIATFQKYYPEIADAIASYQVPEGFHINVTTSGYGNVDDPVTGMPVYSDDPIAQSKAQIARNVEQPFFTHTNYAGFAVAKPNDSYLHAQYMRKLGEIVRDARPAEALERLPERTPTGMLFGLGLGYHLELLLADYQFDYLFICEPQFELFFGSLFCIDWAGLIEKVDAQGGNLYLHLGVTYQEFFKDVWMVSENIGAFSLVKSYCHQHYPSEELTQLIKDFQKRYFELQMGFGFYNDARTSIAHTISNCEQELPFLTALGKTPHKEQPVFIIGNGPSLDEAADFIRANQDNAIVVAAGTALTSLERLGITPDFHVLTERPKVTYDVLLHALPKETYKKYNLMTLNVMYPDVLDLYKWSGLALKPKEAGTDLYMATKMLAGQNPPPQLGYCGPLVSNTALAFFVHMGFENIFLFGVDNGTAIGEQHHSKHSMYFDSKIKNSDKSKKHKFSIKVKGNLSEQVLTNKLLLMSKTQMERLLAGHSSKNIQCFNVGDGAYIEGTLPVAIDELMVLPTMTDKEGIIDSIKDQHFNLTSAKGLKEQIDMPLFDQICEHITSIANETVESRSQALDNLRRQSRYLYSLRGTQYSYIHFIIEGSLLYYHCPMMTMLYSYNDESYCLSLYQEMQNIWVEYLTTIKQNFNDHYLDYCDKHWKVLEDL